MPLRRSSPIRNRSSNAVAARIEQAAVVMLAMDFDEAIGDVAQQRRRDPRPACESGCRRRP
jgi:hypothetical protein